jgi:hypothetical protein
MDETFFRAKSGSFLLSLCVDLPMQYMLPVVFHYRALVLISGESFFPLAFDFLTLSHSHSKGAEVFLSRKLT